MVVVHRLRKLLKAGHAPEAFALVSAFEGRVMIGAVQLEVKLTKGCSGKKCLMINPVWCCLVMFGLHGW